MIKWRGTHRLRWAHTWPIRSSSCRTKRSDWSSTRRNSRSKSLISTSIQAKWSQLTQTKRS